MDIEEEPVALPSARPVRIASNITLQPPLSRRGHGPGLILLTSIEIILGDRSEALDPFPLQKWAEEGYAVVEVKGSRDSNWDASADVTRGIQSLIELPECDVKDNFGLIIYSSSSLHSEKVSIAIERNLKHIAGIVAFGVSSVQTSIPLLQHLPKAQERASDVTAGQISTSIYPEAQSENFVLPNHVDYKLASAAVAHTRSLTFLKKHSIGPVFDLEAIWDEHTEYEFGNRSLAKTMGTMVQEPYVNHIPTMTGGIGRKSLSNFYRYHFIWNNPHDTALELVSRTVGIDRVVDEFVFTFTHNKVIDWILPGVPPTGKAVRIPFTSVVNIRGDRLCHEHIAWDQATVLVQLGLMPEYLPFPYDLPDGRKPAPGKRFEYRVPAAGVETANKLVDETSEPSNEMLKFEIREVEI